MKAEAEDQQVSYQWALRVAGSVLDERERLLHALLETPDGLTLVTKRWHMDETLADAHLSHDDLMAKRERLVGQRTLETPDTSRQSALQPELAPGWYADILRAVGGELDTINAFNILVHQVNDQLYVAYVFRNPHDNYIPAKRRVLLGPKDIEVVLREARGRRAPDDGPTLWSRLAGRQKWPARVG